MQQLLFTRHDWLICVSLFFSARRDRQGPDSLIDDQEDKPRHRDMDRPSARMEQPREVLPVRQDSDRRIVREAEATSIEHDEPVQRARRSQRGKPSQEDHTEIPEVQPPQKHVEQPRASRSQRDSRAAHTDVETDFEDERSHRSGRSRAEQSHAANPVVDEASRPSEKEPSSRKRGMSFSASVNAGLSGLRETVSKAVEGLTAKNEVARQEDSEPEERHSKHRSSRRERRSHEQDTQAKAAPLPTQEEEPREQRPSAAATDTEDESPEPRRRSRRHETTDEETELDRIVKTNANLNAKGTLLNLKESYRI